MTTSNRITNLLNRRSMTVAELATELGITRNSVHLQITRLEAAGLLERVQQRRSNNAGKPAYEYRAVAGSEDAYSSAYKSILESLMQVLAVELPIERRQLLLQQAGQLLARNAGLQPVGNIETDLRQAVDAVNSLGAMAEIADNKTCLTVTSYSCPVATSVRSEPETCSLVAAFFSEATGKAVVSKCWHECRLVCQFEVANR